MGAEVATSSSFLWLWCQEVMSEKQPSLHGQGALTRTRTGLDDIVQLPDQPWNRLLLVQWGNNWPCLRHFAISILILGTTTSWLRHPLGRQTMGFCLPACFCFCFWCGWTVKSLVNLVQYCFCFIFWFLAPEACGVLAPWPGIKPAPPALESKVLTTGPPGRAQVSLFAPFSKMIWKLPTRIYQKVIPWDVPGGVAVPMQGTCLISGPEKSHVPWSNWTHVPQCLKPVSLEPVLLNERSLRPAARTGHN